VKSDKRIAFIYAVITLLLLLVAAGGVLGYLGTGYSIERFREEQAAHQVRKRAVAPITAPASAIPAAPDADTSPSLGAPPVQRPDSNP
jgi:hypothetical protein